MLKLEIIIISDVHSNLEALNAVSEDISHLPIYCTGDIVGYGANPKEVIQWMKKSKTKAVLGNHDYAVITGNSEWFNAEAIAAINWTSKHIGSTEKEYLSNLSEIDIVSIGDLKIKVYEENYW